MPLDFFGLDFASAKDGKSILFEANATMSFMAHSVAIQRFEYFAAVRFRRRARLSWNWSALRQ